MNRITVIVAVLITVMTSSLNAQKERSANDAHGIEVGTKAPVFKAVDASNQEFSLNDALIKGPVVLIFYRGYWCPVCNKHLKQVQDSLQLIIAKGATVIAVSPEKPEYLDKMAEKTGAKFKLLYDEGYKIANAYDVTFNPDAKQLFVYNTMLHADLKKTHSDESQRLPIPATYVIDKNGTIIWRQFDPDYKKRASVSDIIKALPNN